MKIQAEDYGFERLRVTPIEGRFIAEGYLRFQTFTGRGDTPDAAISHAKALRDAMERPATKH